MTIQLDFDGRWRGPKSLGTATLGTAWAAVGTQYFKTGGARWLAAYLDLTINTSVDPRFRLQSYTESGGSAYCLPIATDNGSYVLINDEYVEFPVDSDQKQVVLWELSGAVPFCTFQGSVGTAGETAAYLNAVDLVSAI
jgi:hypothetical protein